MSKQSFTISDPRSLNNVLDSYSLVTGRLSSSPPENVPLSDDTIPLVTGYSILPLVTERDAAIAVQISDTRTFNIHKFIVSSLIKQQTNELNDTILLHAHPFNSGIKPNDRHYYGLPVDKDSYPDLRSYKKIVKTAEKYIKGEQKRIEDGGPALKGITWEVLEIWTNILKAKYELHINSFLAARAKQALLTAKVNEYITDVYPEMKADIQHFFRHLDKEAFNEIAALWGILFVKYGEDSNIYSRVSGYTSFEGSPIDSVKITFVKDDKIIHSEESGYYSSNLISIGFTDIIAELSPYKTITLTHYEIKPDTDNSINFEFEMGEE